MRKILPVLLLSSLGLSACSEKAEDKGETARISDGKGGAVTISTDRGERVQITDKDGQNTTVSTVATDVKLPEFAPAYPGATPQQGRTGLVSKNAEGIVTQISYVTQDSPEKVAAYYKSTLEAAGMSVSAMGSGNNYVIKTKGKTGSAEITLRNAGGITRIAIAATEKP